MPDGWIIRADPDLKTMHAPKKTRPHPQKFVSKIAKTD
jgi:hypothetical protein